MHILIGLTYYRPHYSGLTIYSERLARSLVQLGHRVTVLTSRYLPELPAQEVQHGVEIIRPDVKMHLSKGVIMPTLPKWAYRILHQADIANLHLPQMDAAYVSWMARMMGKPVVMTYHCDLKLPHGAVHWIANQGSHLFSHATAFASNLIITNTRDYAEHSGFLRRYLRKMRFIPPPIEVPEVSEKQLQAFRAKNDIRPGQRIIGMGARLATEKGVEYLIRAMPEVLERHPTARVLHQGQYQNVLGEEQYAQKLAPLIEKLGDKWKFLGVVSAEEQAAFFHTSEVMVAPSLNSTESFNMVQVEAMTRGTPAVSSDLPGVRCPIQETGMGKVIPLRDSHALAQAIIEILDNPQKYAGDPARVCHHYSSETVAREYEAIFKELLSKK